MVVVVVVGGGGVGGSAWIRAVSERSVSSAASSSAAMCLSLSLWTWSCIRLTSGHTISVRPGTTSAGSWKQSDLPAPVGSTAKQSRFERHALMTWRWRGRKVAWPKSRSRLHITAASHSKLPLQSAPASAAAWRADEAAAGAEAERLAGAVPRAGAAWRAAMRARSVDSRPRNASCSQSTSSSSACSAEIRSTSMWSDRRQKMN